MTNLLMLEKSNFNYTMKRMMMSLIHKKSRCPQVEKCTTKNLKRRKLFHQCPLKTFRTSLCLKNLNQKLINLLHQLVAPQKWLKISAILLNIYRKSNQRCRIQTESAWNNPEKVSSQPNLKSQLTRKSTVKNITMKRRRSNKSSKKDSHSPDNELKFKFNNFNFKNLNFTTFKLVFQILKFRIKPVQLSGRAVAS